MTAGIRRCMACGLAALAAGCGAGWHRSPSPPVGPLPARQQVEVWRRGSALRWHAVVVGADSVSGVPFILPVTCDSCRVQLPRTEVDSLRLGNPVGGFWRSVGLVLGLGLAFYATAYSLKW